MFLTPSGSLNLNIDSKTLDACLKSINQIGGTTYQNICTGQSAYVGWGSVDWFGALLILSFIILLFLFIGWAIKSW